MANILIIDDNDAVCTALKTLFMLQGYQAHSVASEQQALAYLATAQVDLILQDMNFAKGEMDGAAGKALFYQLRQCYPDIPVILMTAWTSLDMVVELVKAGATDYIAKPWDDQRLLTTVANVLKIKQLTEQNLKAERKQQERLGLFAGKDLCGLVFASSAAHMDFCSCIQIHAKSRPRLLFSSEHPAGTSGMRSKTSKTVTSAGIGT